MIINAKKRLLLVLVFSVIIGFFMFSQLPFAYSLQEFAPGGDNSYNCNQLCSNHGLRCVIGVDDQIHDQRCSEVFRFEGSDDWCVCTNNYFNLQEFAPGGDNSYNCNQLCSNHGLSCVMGVDDQIHDKICSEVFRFEGSDDWCVCVGNFLNAQEVFPSQEQGTNIQDSCKNICENKNMECVIGVDDQIHDQRCSEVFRFEAGEEDDWCVCAEYCEDDWGNCDDNWDNGCEADLLTDRDNCGECGNVCTGNQECNYGSCSFTDEHFIEGGCSDGIDNDGDGPVDMNDGGCQASCRDEDENEGLYEDYREEVNTDPSAISGADGCCGDDNISDKGYIDPSSIFLCNDDLNYDEEDEDWIGEWFPADGVNNELKIYNIKLTGSDDDVISNSFEWFVCDATGDSPLGGNHISNLQTFENACNYGERICATPPGFDVVVDLANCSSPTCCLKYNNDCYDSLREPWDGTPQSCGQCYINYVKGEKSGNPYKKNYNNESTGEHIQKDQIGSLSSGKDIGDKNKTCKKDLHGTLCPGTSFCAPFGIDNGGYYIYASDTEEGRGCCYGYCIEEEVTDLTCAERGGTIMPANEEGVLKCNVEIDASDTITDPDNICCVDYSWNLEGPALLGKNESFVCYNRDDRNLWAECCYLSACDNLKLIDDVDKTKNNNFDNGNIFTTGSELYTLESFNKKIAGDNVYVVDFSQRWEIIEGSDPGYVSLFMPGYQTDAKNQTAVKDYSDYSFIEFDIGFRDVMVDSVTFCLEDGSKKPFSLSEQTILPEITPNVFHHIIIPLDGFNSPIESYEFTYSFPEGGVATENSIIYVDDFVLRPKTEDTLYCTGPFRTWIDSLNPEGEIDPDDFWSYGPQWYACNNKLSFGWTGTRCCGAESTLTEKEFYNDNNAGCWNSIFVRNDFTVTESLRGKSYANNPSYEDNNILFFNGAFYGCNLEKTIAASQNLWGENLNVGKKNHYSVLGTHYCSPDGNIWKTLDQAPSMAMLAAKLYQLALEKTEDDETISYTLHCANASVINYDKWVFDKTSGEISNEFKESLCVLRLVEGGEERVIMGAVVTNITGFIEKEIIYYYPLKEENEPENIENTCKGIYARDTDFERCMEYNNRAIGSGFYMYFNDKYRIAVFSQEPITEFEDSNFLIEMWNDFRRFIKNIFGFKEEEIVDDLPNIIKDIYS